MVSLFIAAPCFYAVFVSFLLLQSSWRGRERELIERVDCFTLSSLSGKKLYVLELQCGLFARVVALRSSQQNCSHALTFYWDEPVLNSEDLTSCLRTQYSASGEARTKNLSISTPAHTVDCKLMTI